MDRDRTGAFEMLVLAAGGLLLATGVAVASGAALAAAVVGRPIVPTFEQTAEALSRLPTTPADPQAAWPHEVAARLPGSALYWACTVTAFGLVVGLVALAARWWLGPAVGSLRRRPLGVDGRAAFASTGDLAPVLVDDAQAGRLVIAQYGRRLVATEARAAGAQRRPTGTSAARRGDRGAVALVGPTRSGKTVAIVGGVLEWEGPAVLSSVKSDLLEVTAGWRRSKGEVRVYDPTGTVPGAAQARASWSPVRQAGTIVGAQRAARALCDAAPRGGVEGGLDFWLAQAEILLSGLLFVAHHTKQHMGTVCTWVLTQDRPGERGPGDVWTSLKYLASSDDDIDVALAAAEVAHSLDAIWEMEERTRSSVYATAQTLVWPWSAPSVAASSTGESVDLDWLLAGENTLYLSSPIEDQRRLAPAFGGVLNDVVNQAYRRVAATGKPLDPPLLVVIDEAGNTPLRSLPEYASTLAGIGVLLVTIWQSLAQLEAAYGRQADTILTNHLTKLFYAGLSDKATLGYVAQVLGDAEVETVSRSADEHAWRGTIQRSTSRVPLTPAHALRQMRPGDALLLHGTLPPAHVRARRYYQDRRLAERAALPPFSETPAEAGPDDDGRTGDER